MEEKTTRAQPRVPTIAHPVARLTQRAIPVVVPPTHSAVLVVAHLAPRPTQPTVSVVAQFVAQLAQLPVPVG